MVIKRNISDEEYKTLLGTLDKLIKHIEKVHKWRAKRHDPRRFEPKYNLSGTGWQWGYTAKERARLEARNAASMNNHYHHSYLMDLDIHDKEYDDIYYEVRPILLTILESGRHLDEVCSIFGSEKIVYLLCLIEHFKEYYINRKYGEIVSLIENSEIAKTNERVSKEIENAKNQAIESYAGSIYQTIKYKYLEKDMLDEVLNYKSFLINTNSVAYVMKECIPGAELEWFKVGDKTFFCAAKYDKWYLVYSDFTSKDSLIRELSEEYDVPEDDIQSDYPGPDLGPECLDEVTAAILANKAELCKDYPDFVIGKQTEQDDFTK